MEGQRRGQHIGAGVFCAQLSHAATSWKHPADPCAVGAWLSQQRFLLLLDTDEAQPGPPPLNPFTLIRPNPRTQPQPKHTQDPPPLQGTMRATSGLSALAALGAALLVALQAPLPTAEAISDQQAKNLTRVLYLHNYPTMLFYKSMYNVRV